MLGASGRLFFLTASLTGAHRMGEAVRAGASFSVGVALAVVQTPGRAERLARAAGTDAVVLGVDALPVDLAAHTGAGLGGVGGTEALLGSAGGLDRERDTAAVVEGRRALALAAGGALEREEVSRARGGAEGRRAGRVFDDACGTGRLQAVAVTDASGQARELWATGGNAGLQESEERWRTDRVDMSRTAIAAGTSTAIVAALEPVAVGEAAGHAHGVIGAVRAQAPLVVRIADAIVGAAAQSTELRFRSVRADAVVLAVHASPVLYAARADAAGGWILVAESGLLGTGQLGR